MSTLGEDRGSLSKRYDLRNVIIVTHVDHGKTTLVDIMLWQSGTFGERATVEKTGERVMDSGDLEHEEGITILAKNTTIRYTGSSAAKFNTPEDMTINVIGTPGHADFSGEVEHGLSVIDGVVLLVDASGGPLPRTRSVLRKAFETKLSVITVVNKAGRPDARIDEMVNETQDLLLSLYSGLDNPDDAILDQPLEISVIFYAAKTGYADTFCPEDGELPANRNLGPLFETTFHCIPAPEYDTDIGLVAQTTNLDASPFLGRLALARIYSGELTKGAWVDLSGEDGVLSRVHISELLATEGLNRKPMQIARAGDIVAIAGVEDITIGDCLVDLDDPRPLPPIHVGDPVVLMTVGINDSPLAGKVKEHKLTARQVRDRLKTELVGNVSIRVLPTDRPDQWEVQDRGEPTLAILVEQVWRKGFGLTVSKPQVVTKMADNKVHEPMEWTTIDISEECLGAVTQIMAARKGRMETMSNHGSDWVRIELVIPARGMIGFRSRFLTQTRGTGIAPSIGDGHAPWAGPVESRVMGSLVSDRQSQVTAYALQKLEDRGAFLVEPGQKAYEGQVMGENPRDEGMDINVMRMKEMMNVRSIAVEVFETLQAPRKLTLGESIEFTANDRCIEVTPEAVRIRKVILDTQKHYRAAARARRGK